MTEKVTLLRLDNSPIPPFFPASPEELAEWYAGQMLRSLGQGERSLSISCFDAARCLGFDAGRTARMVLKAVTDVLYDHPEAESLIILCCDEASYRTYSFYWNMLYAEFKPAHEE